MPEKAPSIPTARGRALVAVILAAIILLPVGYSIISSVIATGAEPAEMRLERPDVKYQKCIKDTEYMRHHHWEVLRAAREKVVRYGEREEIEIDGKPVQLGLNACQQCHTSRERFCNVCHDATSLTPDCFGCHYYP